MSEQSAAAVRGVLRITISDPPLNVQLTFERSDDGDTWDLAGLQAALRERKITPMPEDSALKGFLEHAAKASGPYNDILLEGMSPVAPNPERPRWGDLTLQEDLETCAAAVLEKAPPPKITRAVTQKVQRQKVVEKKGPLGKVVQETVTVTESQTSREKVFVDPTVLEVFHVAGGAALGRIEPHSPGIPGRDVYGRTIPVRTLPNPHFHPGEGLAMRDGVLTALTEGFLRVGKNWADVVPWQPHRWSVELSPDKATCLLSFTRGTEGQPLPDAREILQAAADLEYPEESLIPVEDITSLLEQLADAPHPAAEPVPISVSRDGAFDIAVTEDRLMAMLNIHKGKGRGRRLTLKEIGGAIRDSKLKGLNLEKIRDDVTAFYSSADTDLTGYVLCEGTPAVPGPERQVDFAVDFDKEERTTAVRQQFLAARETVDPGDTTVHMESLEAFPPEEIQHTATVQAEQLICTVDPPTPGESGADVYGTIIPGEPAAEPQIELHENLIRRESKIVTTCGGVLDMMRREEVLHLRVRESRDAHLKVDVSPDRMSAALSLRNGEGSGTRLTREMVDQAIEQAGVQYGIDEEVVARAFEGAIAGVAVRDLEFASGTEPIHQTENQVEFFVKPQKEGTVRIRQDGTADFRNQDRILTVKAGQEICRILPSHQDPVEGRDVLGNPIPAGTVSEMALELGENLTQVQEEDGSILITAASDGELLASQKKITIVNAHTVKGDVDMSVGNIRFPGSVLIGGSVKSGFMVIATGDVRIAGTVEGSLISSDGTIVIQGGVKGAGKAVLRSKKDIMSPYVELATVLAVGDMVLKSALVRSRIKCNGRITFQGDKGRIIGGQIRARNGIQVESLGSERGIKTTISFGQDYLIGDLIEKEEKETEKIKQRLTRIDRDMRIAEKERKDGELARFRKEKVQLLKLMEKRGLRLFTLRERFEQHFPSKVVVNGAVHSGTVFESHGRIYEVTSARKGIAVEFNAQTGNIDIQDLKDLADSDKPGSDKPGKEN